MPTRRLQRLAQELIDLLAEMKTDEGAASAFGEDIFGCDRVDARSEIEIWYSAAKRIYHVRRLRDRHLKEDLFGEPCWDILLDLFIAECEGRSIQITSACIASCAPQSTALRYIAEMEECDLLTRSRDQIDGRRSYVQLSPKGLGRMIDLLEASAASGVKALTPPRGDFVNMTNNLEKIGKARLQSGKQKPGRLSQAQEQPSARQLS